MTRSLIVAASVALLLGACTSTLDDEVSAEAEEPTDTPTAVMVEDEEPEADSALEASAEPNDPAPDDPAHADPTGAGEQCYVGVWELDLDMFAQAMENTGGFEGGVELDGDLILRFTEGGEYFQIKDEFTIIMSAEGMQARSVTTGALMGSYLVDGDVMHMFDGIDIHHESYLETPAGRVDVATNQDAEVQAFGFQATVPTDATFEIYDGASHITCTDTGLTVDVGGAVVDFYPGELPDMSAWN